MYYCTHILFSYTVYSYTVLRYSYCTPTAGTSTTLDDGGEPASDDGGEQASSGGIKRARFTKVKKIKQAKKAKKAKKGKKGKGKGRATTDEWVSEDDIDESDESGGSVVQKKARGRWDRGEVKRGSSSHASYHHGNDNADSNYTASVAGSNYSSS